MCITSALLPYQDMWYGRRDCIVSCLKPVIFDFKTLQKLKMHGFRNGLWRRLSDVERALYKASMWYVRVQGKIVNIRVLGLLNGIAERLRKSGGSIVFRFGQLRAEELNAACLESGVFNWCSHIEAWLSEDSYVFYLGVNWKNSCLLFRSPLAPTT